MRIRRTTWRLWLYFGCSLAAFVIVAMPALNGELDLQFYSDSLTYENFARQMDLNLGLITIGGNFLGPILIFKTLGYNRLLVVLFNIVCLAVAFRVFSATFPLDRRRFLLYLTISPLLFVSLLSLNKEIVSLPALAFFAAYVERRRLWYLVPALALSILVRWQFTMFMLVFLLVDSPLNPFRRHRLVSLVMLTLAISVLYVRYLGTFEALDRVAFLAAQEHVGGSGLYSRFIAVQNNYGYFLVVVPKALQQMLGLLFRVPRGYEQFIFFVNVIMVWQAWATAFLLVRVGLLRRYVLADNLLYIAWVFAAVFALSPIYSPRYFFPVYVLLAAILARRERVGKPRLTATAVPVQALAGETPGR
ncbi:MAG: hypothetical protein ACREMX_07165 [Gemmatimonadales bacterium]